MMKHYDELEWLFYKERVISEEKYNEMENHLYECDECMNIFLSLIDNEEINSAEEIISDNFTGSVMDNIKSFKNKSISKVERTNMRFKNIFGYYVAVAAVAIILTWGGFFSSLVDTLPKAAKSAINENTLNTPNIVFNISEKIVNRTSNFIDNFQNINRKRIYRLMKILGLRSVTRKKKNNYVKSTPDYVAENILNRDFIANKANKKWVTDVTEFKYGANKKAYLSAIMDLYDNSIVAFKIGHSNNNQLVFDTLEEAIKNNLKAKPLIHSDRGYQYTSYGFKRMLELQGMTQSMSRPGKCIDNGPMESFWGKIKSERYYLRFKKEGYNTFEELEKDIEDYIEFYNNDRPQKKCDGFAPIEYRMMAA